MAKVSAKIKEMFANAETLGELKMAYLEACKKYKGQGGMGEVNGLWNKYFDEVKTWNKTKDGKMYEKACDEGSGDFTGAIKELLKIKGITLEMCGTWLWVGDEVEGTTKENRDSLKKIGCRYAPNKQMWYIAPKGARRSHKHYSMDEIRAMHGSEEVEA